MSNEEKREIERELLEKARNLLRYAEERDAIPAGGFVSVSAWPDHISVTIYNDPNHAGNLWELHAWADPRNAEMEVQIG